jgi:hypothetical protein
MNMTVAALNPCHRVITETHSAEHYRVDLHEHRPAPGHVVRRPGVQDPCPGTALFLLIKVGEHLLLVDLHLSTG